MLITLLLCAEGALSEPLLYLSLYFKTHRDLYYHWLQRVRLEGDWEGWISYFLEGVETTAREAVDAARRIIALTRFDETRLALLKNAELAIKAHRHLCRHPLTTIQSISSAMAVSVPTATKLLKQFLALGIVREITGGRRNRVYSYTSYLDILSEGAAPLRQQ